MDREDHHEREQAGHHELRDALDARLHAEIADAATERDRERHIARHRQRIREQRAEHLPHARGIEPLEPPAHHQINVVKHPAGDRRVEHHEQEIARNRAVFIEMPFRPRRLEHIERHRRAAHARASHGELRHHDGQPEDCEEDKIDEHERRPAVHPRDIREAPDIAEPDGTAGRDQDEAQPR